MSWIDWRELGWLQWRSPWRGLHASGWLSDHVSKLGGRRGSGWWWWTACGWRNRKMENSCWSDRSRVGFLASAQASPGHPTPKKTWCCSHHHRIILTEPRPRRLEPKDLLLRPLSACPPSSAISDRATRAPARRPRWCPIRTRSRIAQRLSSAPPRALLQSRRLRVLRPLAGTTATSDLRSPVALPINRKTNSPSSLTPATSKSSSLRAPMSAGLALAMSAHTPIPRRRGESRDICCTD